MGTVLLVNLVKHSSFSDDLPMTFRRMFQCSLVRWEKTRSVLQEIDLRICMGKWVRRALLHEAASLGAELLGNLLALGVSMELPPNGWFRMENPKLFRKPPFANGVSNDFPRKIAGFVVSTIGDFPFAAWNISRGHVQFWMHSQSWTPVTSWP